MLLWYVALIASLLLAPTAFDSTQADWQFNEAAGSLSGMSYETLTAVITGIQLALASLSLISAALIIRRTMHPVALLAAVTLIGMIFLFNLAGNGDAASYSDPWQEILNGIVTFLGIAGLVTLLLMFYLLPDGHFYPPWSRYPVLATVAIIPLTFAAGEMWEYSWIILTSAMLMLLLLGVAGQIVRYRRADPNQRRQTIGFLIAAAALPIWLIINLANFSPLMSLIAGYMTITLIIIGLYLAARRGAWGDFQDGRFSLRLITGITVALMIVIAGVAVAWWQDNRPAAIDLTAATAADRIPVILDADMAMDDIGALFFLLRHPAVELRAITVNGVAFAHCDGGVRNALGLLEVARAPEIPVSCGRDEAFPGGTPAPDDWRASADNLYGAQVMIRDRTADPRAAAELLGDTIRAAPGEIIVVAIGPLTNLAEAFQADPALAGQIKELIIMGGAVNAPGNVSDAESANRTAEWNFFADPVAADIVLASGAPITLVPLDATNDVPFTRGFYERLRSISFTRPAVFTYNLMYMNQWWLDGGMYWWDTLAAAVVTEKDLVTTEEMALDVVTDEGPEMGRTVETPNGATMRVATAADQQAFEALFLAVLNHE